MAQVFPRLLVLQLKLWALAKALLVAFFFMHLRSAHYMLRITAAAGFFWLAILICLSLTDFLAR
jgi:cytochrome c oxidase subunit 4